MSIFLVFAGGIVVVVLMLLALGMWWPGNGDDLLDIDPRGRAEHQAEVDAEDLQQLSELRRRRAN